MENPQIQKKTVKIYTLKLDGKKRRSTSTLVYRYFRCRQEVVTDHLDLHFEISGFRTGVAEAFVLLGCYVA